MTRRLAHILTTKPVGEGWTADIECPYQLDTILPDTDVEAAHCRTYWECGNCNPTEDQWEDLAAEGKGACPDSPNGLHYYLNGGGPWIPTATCMARSDPSWTYADVRDIHEAHGHGTFVVDVTWEEDEYVQITALAAIEGEGS